MFLIQEKTPAGSWLLEVFLGFYVLEFVLFVGRFFSSANNFAGLLFCWLSGSKSVRVDDSHRVFNLDCLVSI